MSTTDDRHDDDRVDAAELIRAAPGLARIAAVASIHAAEWGVGAYVRTLRRMVEAVRSGQSPADLLATAGSDLRHYLRVLLEVPDPDEEVQEERPAAPEDALRDPAGRGNGHTEDSAATLRERGAELLRRSADVGWDDEAHPAYEQILAQLAPDEGRILRLLALEGPQASIDVRTGGALGVGVVGTQLVAFGLSMIGSEAGVRHLDRVQAYLNNLERLGLIWFSREPLENPNRYQVLEAQPDSEEALDEAGRAGRTVRRSIHLTPFGEDFCETCLPLHTGEIDQLPGGNGDGT